MREQQVKRKAAITAAFLLLMANLACRNAGPATTLPAAETSYRTDTVRFINQTLRRPIPVRLYWPASGQSRHWKVALLNHGYGGTNDAYAFIARILVAHGYLVASLQQDLPGDAPMPTTGNLYEARKPIWERGVQNMLVVLSELRHHRPRLDFQHTLLVGHSNGGDMVVLFAKEHPELVQKVISLDNRRMPFPRQRQPRVLTLRSSDQVADPGVLPTSAEQAESGIRVIQLPATLHNAMWDGATEVQKQEMGRCIADFLAE